MKTKQCVSSEPTIPMMYVSMNNFVANLYWILKIITGLQIVSFSMKILTLGFVLFQIQAHFL